MNSWRTFQVLSSQGSALISKPQAWSQKNILLDPRHLVVRVCRSGGQGHNKRVSLDPWVRALHSRSKRATSVGWAKDYSRHAFLPPDLCAPTSRVCRSGGQNSKMLLVPSSAGSTGLDVAVFRPMFGHGSNHFVAKEHIHNLINMSTWERMGFCQLTAHRHT